MVEQVIEHLHSDREAILERLKALLRIPSVSPDPAYALDMAEARRFLVARLAAIGLVNVQELQGGGEPAIYGEWTQAVGKPTIIVYGHYDVQSAEPLDQWKSPPFEPTIRGNCLFARGASDVKGSTMIALEVIAAYLAVHGTLPVNVKVFLEGEEETGSPTLNTIVARHHALLRADGVLSADGGRASATMPTINTGARGNGQLEIRLRTAAKDLHSGRYGGAVRNALHEMARLIATLHDADGRVMVEGFYEGVLEPSGRQRFDTAAFPFNEVSFFADVNAVPHGEPGYTARERITLRPSLDVNGMWGGYTGAGGKTIIPCEAGAKMTVRLVEGQKSQDVISKILQHLRDHCPEDASLSIVHQHFGAPAATLPPDHPLVLAAETVLFEETGIRPIHVRLGASVPVTALFKETLGIETLMFGYNLPDEDVHAPNEFFRLTSIDEGVRGWARLFEGLATYPPDSFH
ncbi:Acetylornithine deacetylase/Succinyl-diaminopimelate desuccinylase [Burkholderia sp. OK233]|nr:Acetylornithine deacetylase/Succinyl-diaminopimelate desuccinylase [Burkholderia sp. OK233]